MKANLKEGWLPKWFTTMPQKHRKVNGLWVSWMRPKPTGDPKTTNHQKHLARQELRKLYG